MGKIDEVRKSIDEALPQHLAGTYEKVAIEALWRNIEPPMENWGQTQVNRNKRTGSRICPSERRSHCS